MNQMSDVADVADVGENIYISNGCGQLFFFQNVPTDDVEGWFEANDIHFCVRNNFSSCEWGVLDEAKGHMIHTPAEGWQNDEEATFDLGDVPGAGVTDVEDVADEKASCNNGSCIGGQAFEGETDGLLYCSPKCAGWSDYESEECTDDNRCEECTHCARTKVCDSCNCVGGCENWCEYVGYGNS